MKQKEKFALFIKGIEQWKSKKDNKIKEQLQQKEQQLEKDIKPFC